MAIQHVDRQTFMRRLRQSGLLSDSEIARISPRLPKSERGRVLARVLVEKGVLTRFQAERLLAGLTQGFLLDQYVILEHLGRGGMGRVYKACHRTMNRIVALKVLASHLVNTPRAEQLFRREVEAAGKLQHPNIVAAYDANKVGDRYYLVLEYVDGPNLDQLVRRQGPLSIGRACDFVRQMATGLQCAHVLGMVHRDVKPGNALLQPHGVAGEDAPGLVKLSDFGLARLQSPNDGNQPTRTILASPRKVMGTPDFLSPEQARDLHSVDIRSDLYSLGCTFYFLLTGQPPFPGGSALDKLIRHSTDEPRAVETYRDDAPVEVAAVLRRLMAKNPDERFQEPCEVVTALEPFSVSGPTPWEPPRPNLDEPLEDLTAPTDDFDPDAEPPRLELVETDAAEVLRSTFPPDLAPEPIIGDSSERMRSLGGTRLSLLQRLLLWSLGLLAPILIGAFLLRSVL